MQRVNQPAANQVQRLRIGRPRYAVHMMTTWRSSNAVSGNNVRVQPDSGLRDFKASQYLVGLCGFARIRIERRAGGDRATGAWQPVPQSARHRSARPEGKDRDPHKPARRLEPCGSRRRGACRAAGPRGRRRRPGAGQGRRQSGVLRQHHGDGAHRERVRRRHRRQGRVHAHCQHQVRFDRRHRSGRWQTARGRGAGTLPVLFVAYAIIGVRARRRSAGIAHVSVVLVPGHRDRHRLHVVLRAHADLRHGHGAADRLHRHLPSV